MLWHNTSHVPPLLFFLETLEASFRWNNPERQDVNSRKTRSLWYENDTIPTKHTLPHTHTHTHTHTQKHRPAFRNSTSLPWWCQLRPIKNPALKLRWASYNCSTPGTATHIWSLSTHTHTHIHTHKVIAYYSLCTWLCLTFIRNYFTVHKVVNLWHKTGSYAGSNSVK